MRAIRDERNPARDDKRREPAITLSEQLATLEQELKRLLTADDAELTNAVEQTKLPEWAAEVDPEAYIAGTLLSVEWACKLLRDRLAVPLEVVCRIELDDIQLTGPLEEEDTPAPAAPH